MLGNHEVQIHPLSISCAGSEANNTHHCTTTLCLFIKKQKTYLTQPHVGASGITKVIRIHHIPTDLVCNFYGYLKSGNHE